MTPMSTRQHYINTIYDRANIRIHESSKNSNDIASNYFCTKSTDLIYEEFCKKNHKLFKKSTQKIHSIVLYIADKYKCNDYWINQSIKKLTQLHTGLKIHINNINKYCGKFIQNKPNIITWVKQYNNYDQSLRDTILISVENLKIVNYNIIKGNKLFYACEILIEDILKNINKIINLRNKLFSILSNPNTDIVELFKDIIYFESVRIYTGKQVFNYIISKLFDCARQISNLEDTFNNNFVKMDSLFEEIKLICFDTASRNITHGIGFYEYPGFVYNNDIEDDMAVYDGIGNIF